MDAHPTRFDADPARPLPWERAAHPAPTTANQLWERIARGWQPELHQKPAMDAQAWFSGYVQTYLERDVRLLHQVGDLTQFQAFLRTLARRTAQLLSLSELSRDLGVAVSTIKAWISVLETSHLVIQLRP